MRWFYYQFLLLFVRVYAGSARCYFSQPSAARILLLSVKAFTVFFIFSLYAAFGFLGTMRGECSAFRFCQLFSLADATDIWNTELKRIIAFCCLVSAFERLFKAAAAYSEIPLLDDAICTVRIGMFLLF